MSDLKDRRIESTQAHHDLEAAPNTRITFSDSRHTGRDEYRNRPARPPVSRRSVSRDSIRSIESRSQEESARNDLRIQFQTLSVQVADSNTSQRSEHADANIQSKDDRNYFASLVFHKLSPEEICNQFNVFEKQGLSCNMAVTRLQRDGPNAISKARPNYLSKILLYIFGDFCSVLRVGVIIFFLCWRPLSNPPSTTNLALAILVIIVIFLQASFSAFQDWSTQRVINSILELLPSKAFVLRDGKFDHISTNDLVAGDIVQVKIGDKVPADFRLLSHSGDVRFDRSILTGESDEIEGVVDYTDESFLESRNIAFMGTMVTSGNAIGIVILTGTRTVMGRIAKSTAGVRNEPTLIQREITRFVVIIVSLTICLALTILVTWAGWLRVQHSAFMSVVAMLNDVMGCVVAFIPEGMPVAVALALMLIAKRMKAANILPKGLTTVETMGCVNVICSDKTGTLTENQMFVATIAGLGKQFKSVEEAYQTFARDPIPEELVELHRAAVLCNDAMFNPITLHLPMNKRGIQGNATDAAVLRFAETAWLGENVRATSPRVFEIAFNSKNKYMVTLYSEGQRSQHEKAKYKMHVKDAPDILMPHCTRIARTIGLGILTPFNRLTIPPCHNSQRYKTDFLRMPKE